MEANEDRHEAVEATTTVPGSDPRSGERAEEEEEERVRRRNKWNGMKLAAEAEGDVDEDDLEEDEVRSVDSRLPFKARPLISGRIKDLVFVFQILSRLTQKNDENLQLT